MQRYLRDILANPPHSLGQIANFLLIASAVLLASIFLVEHDEKDITLNLIYGQTAKKVDPLNTQTAAIAYKNLTALVSDDQEVRKGDTLFTALTNGELNSLSLWRDQLAAQKMIPTAEMLENSLVSSTIRKKMIALARAQILEKNTPSKVKADKAKDGNRLKKVNTIISELDQEVADLEKAIPKFKDLERKEENKYFSLRDAYELKEVTLAELKKAKYKWDEKILDTKQREGQLKTAKLKLREYKSESAYLRKVLKSAKGNVIPKRNGLLIYETDLLISLDSLWSNSMVVSEFAGKVHSIGKLKNVGVNDVLLVVKGELEAASNRSKLIYAEAGAKESRNIYPGSNLLIFLQDGSTVKGEIVSINDNSHSSKQMYEIAAVEPLIQQDIDQIILPSKKGNFIEKVMENF